MKKNLFLLFFSLLLSLQINAQDPIKNYSFENWQADTGGKLAPADWMYNKTAIYHDVVKRSASGSQGSYAVHLGSYNDNGSIVGSTVEIYDSLIDKPTSITFDYKVANNTNQFLNGLGVDVYFYDSADNYLGDYSWSSPSLKNNSIFLPGEVTFAKSVVDKAKVYLLKLTYYNLPGGAANEYGVIDNLKFKKYTGPGVGVAETEQVNVTVYPNPASDVLNIEAGNTKITRVEVYSLDGKKHEVTSLTEANTAIDISPLANGIYFVAAFGEDNQPLFRNKFTVIK